MMVPDLALQGHRRHEVLQPISQHQGTTKTVDPFAAKVAVYERNGMRASLLLADLSRAGAGLPLTKTAYNAPKTPDMKAPQGCPH
jgi:hypothetical protein